MDINPTFGHQELMETLSQTSNKSSGTSESRSRAGGGDTSVQSSRGNYGNSTSSLMSNSRVGEAYRRVGQKLSMQAHGEAQSQSTTFTALTRSSRSSFIPYAAAKEIQNSNRGGSSSNEPTTSPTAATGGGGSVPPASLSDDGHDRSSPAVSCEEDRYRKVPKTRYSDHGDHHHHHPRLKILRKLTMEGRDSFLLWEQKHRQERKSRSEKSRHRRREEEAGVSPHRHAFSRLALEQNWGNDTNNVGAYGGHHPHHHHHHHGGAAPAKGLLSAVLEGHSDSNTTASGPGYASASISTKDSRTVLSSLGGGGTANTSVGNASASRASPVTTPGKCLTAPSDPVANDGRDNVEGNLIVFEHDSIRIPRRNLHTAGDEKAGQQQGPAEYKVQGLLGQGTFAQVFQCLHVQTGQIVAIKIVKNKPAYTRQATVEIDVFRALKEGNNACAGGSMVDLICYFMHRSHLCLVFELLGQNLYEILKRRQFRGLPLTIVRDIVKQAVSSMRELSQKSIVHCDLKPENVLLVSDVEANGLVAAGEGRRRNPTEDSATTSTNPSISTHPSSEITMQTTHKDDTAPPIGRIKLIDFGSACFEGYTAHTYIQSRFYRSPEVLVGLPYDSVIDIWSLGCVAAELFLGLPILPGIHEHDQLGRISEMISGIPDWMLDQGSKASKYFVKYVPRPVTAESNGSTPSLRGGNIMNESPAPVLPQWRLKTQQEYITSLSQAEIRKKGGLSRLEQQPGNRYFKRTRLADILFLHGLATVGEDKELLPAFVHFLYGLLEPDPWKRWTSFQAVQHPFITGELNKLKRKTPQMEVNAKEENHANIELNVYWEAPWDPAICRRKLLNVQRMREKQQTMRRSVSGRPSPAQTGIGMDSTPERRRSARGMDQSTPAYSSQGSSSLAMDNIDNGHGQGKSSPPIQISSRAAAALASELSRQSIERQFPGGSTQRQIGNYIASSSLTSLGQPGQSGQLVMGDVSPANQRVLNALPSTFLSGPQSFSGLGTNPGNVVNEGDFAMALQRPGVVPGTGTDAASVSSAGTWGTTGQQGQDGIAQLHKNHLSQSHVGPHPGSSSYGHVGTAMSRHNYPGQQQTGSSLPRQNVTGSSLPGQFVSPYAAAQNSTVPASLGSTAAASYGNQYVLNQLGSSVSVASSVTMSEAASTMDLQQQFSQLQQQQQHQAALQQQQQQLAMNQQLGGGGLPAGYALPQQQQVYLAAAPGGGTYYVTTSATGQPIILQPMSMIDPAAASQLGQVFQGQQPGGFLPGQQQQVSGEAGVGGFQAGQGGLPGSMAGQGLGLPGQQAFRQQQQQAFQQPYPQQQQQNFPGGMNHGRNGQPYRQHAAQSGPRRTSTN